MECSDSSKTVIIGSVASAWSLRPRELWQHRELLHFLTLRDIKVKYKQTALGVLWVVIQPLGIALTFSLFLGKLVKVPSEGLPYPLFAYSGMVVWQLFANSLTDSSNSLISNERLITKVYFPRLIIPLSAVLASLLDFAVSLLFLALFLAYYRIVPTVTIAMMPVLVLLELMIASGRRALAFCP